MGRKQKKGTGAAVQAEPPAPGPSLPSARRRRRRIAFRVIAVVGAPLLLLALVELGLRIADVGFDTAFFVRHADGTTIGTNPRFGWRFFPPAIARQPSPIAIKAKKEKNAIRVFVLGSSAAQGFPSPAFGFSRILEYMLSVGFPDRHIEVVNLAMIAVNSHVQVPIARECSELAPDFVIILEGNNEVVGPCGIGTVFGGAGWGHVANRVRLGVQRLRLAQLITGVGHRLASEPLTSWKGMEFFLGQRVAASDPRLAGMYAQFEANLREILSVFSKSTHVLVCTVPVNLRDCAPFGSSNRTDLSSQQADTWKQEFDKSVAALSAGDLAAARAALDRAAAIDNTHAELEFVRAKLMLMDGNIESARASFARSRDLDTLRFRTDSRLNNVIRKVAGESAPKATLIDLEEMFAGKTEQGVPGSDLFLEHCHFNFSGNYLIAVSLYAAISHQLGGPSLKAIPSEADCRRALVYTASEELADAREILELVCRPPFVQQHAHDEDVAQRKRGISLLEAAAATSPAGLAEELYESAIRRNPDDAVMRRAYGTYLLNANHPLEAQKQLSAATDLLPDDPTARMALAAAMLKQGKVGEAERIFRVTLSLPACDRICQAEVLYNLARLDERAGRLNHARERYVEVLRRNEAHIKAHTNLGLLLARMNEWEQAAGHHQRVTELRPDLAHGYLNLALARRAQQRWREGLEAANRALELQPEDVLLLMLAADLHQHLGELDSALAAYEAATRKKPGLMEAHLGCGRLLLEKQEARQALVHLQTAEKLRPDDAQVRRLIQQARQLLADRPITSDN